MPISLRSSRKLLVEQPFSRISESLCWTRGWPTKLTILAVMRSLYPEAALTGFPASSVPRCGLLGKFDGRRSQSTPERTIGRACHHLPVAMRQINPTGKIPLYADPQLSGVFRAVARVQGSWKVHVTPTEPSGSCRRFARET